MFEKLAQFWLLGGHHPIPQAETGHCDDTRIGSPVTTGTRRARRPKLICRWRKAKTARGLECAWKSVAVHGADASGQQSRGGRTHRRARAGAPPRQSVLRSAA
jgi:hypothetical protein